MMAASKTRPGNPDRGWNDPPMFNFSPGEQGAPRRSLNKRVAFPQSGAQPGHAVLNPNQGPPILNPVLSADIQGAPLPPRVPAVPIGMRDTPLGNQATPSSPIQLLPPAADSSTPQTVPLLVPGLVPVKPPTDTGEQPNSGLEDERMEDLLSRLHLHDDTQLLQHDVDTLDTVLEKYKHILTTKVCDDIKKKIEIFGEKWSQGSLSDQVKIRITQLALALVNEETDKAHHLHLALMVDHIAEVNQWMMGIKRLLHQQQLSNKDKELIDQCRSEQNSQFDTTTPSGGDTSDQGESIGSQEKAVTTTQQIESDETCDKNKSVLDDELLKEDRNAIKNEIS